MSKTKYILIAIIFCAITLLGVSAFRQAAQTSNQQDQDDPPTDVQDGIKTPRQKKHGIRFKDHQGAGSRKIRDVISRADRLNRKGEITLQIGVGLIGRVLNPPPFNRQKFVHDIGCDVDAVIIGTRRGKTSQLTEQENFIFADFDFDVNQTFKNNPTNPIPSGGSIVVTRVGGKIRYRGRVVTAVDKNFRPFRKNKQYLLFLKYIPETGSYQAYPNGSFSLQNGKVKQQLGGRYPVAVDGEDAQQFVSYAFSNPCGNRSETDARLR